MAILIILRHGQTTWNLENRITGNTDIDLTPLGRMEAKKAGQIILKYPIQAFYTSTLKRAQLTMEIIQQEMGVSSIGFTAKPALDERNLGVVQGLLRMETETRFGKNQLEEWLHAYTETAEGGETLKQMYQRVVPFYLQELEPKLRSGQNILVVGHGHSLKALMMYLESIPPKETEQLHLAPGIPRAYEFDAEGSVVSAHYLS